MSCDVARTSLHGYMDGELDAVRAAEFEQHLETCQECVAMLEVQESLRASLRNSGLYERAPVSLRKNVRSDLGITPAGAAAALPSHSRASWRWLAVAASFLILAFVGWRLLPGTRGYDDQGALTSEIVDAHLRSLLLTHLTDITSTDQHAVKPWFDGKLDFAPPVRDFGAQGFPLLGGRVDVIRGKAVAVLVYGRRKHIINVFIWPSSAPAAAARPGTKLGYHWIEWQDGELAVHAISDVAPQELESLGQLLRE